MNDAVDGVRRLFDLSESPEVLFGLSAAALPWVGLAVIVVDAEGRQQIVTRGVRDLRSGAPVDADTMFNIGSCSKAFAATLLQALAAEEALDLEAPIQRYAPAFSVLDPWISTHATVHDALVHRVGVASMFFLRMVARSRQDFVARFRYAPETSGFRNRFRYNNSLYMVLAHVTEEVTRREWGQALREKLLSVLGMQRTSADAPRLAQNIAMPHMLEESGESLRLISLDYAEAMRGLSSPSGGVFTSANDFAAWLRFHLRTARGLDTPGLPPADRLRSMQEEKILLDLTARPTTELALLRAGLARAYAYGWSAGEYRGTRVIYHGGATPGYRAAAAVVPDANFAIGILANSDSLNQAAMAFEMLEHALGPCRGLWASEIRAPLPPTDPNSCTSVEPIAIRRRDYVGTFRSTSSYGALTIEAEGPDGLTARFGFMEMSLRAAEGDLFESQIRNDWNGPLGPIGPLRLKFERSQRGTVMRALLKAGKGIDNEPDQLEFMRD